MADLVVGGVRATLGLDATDWARGLRESQRGLKEWQRQIGRSLDDFNRNVSARIAGAGKSLMGFGAAALAGLGVATKAFSDFDAAAREVNSIMRMSESQLGTYRSSIRSLTLDLGLNTSATETMRAAYAAASSGFTDAAEQQEVLRATMLLAKAGMADTQQTMAAMTGTLRAYGAGAAEAADYADILFKTVELGQTTVPELAQNLSKATTTAALAGVQFEELAAAIGVMTVKGMPTAETLTALNAALVKMQAPSTDARKMLDSIGLSADELRRILSDKGLKGAIDALYSASGGDAAILKPILDDTGMRAIQMLGAGGGQDYADALASMADRSGAAARGAAEISKSLSEQAGLLKNLITDLMLSVGEGLAPILSRINEMLRSVIGWFVALPEPVKRAAAVFSAIGAAISLAAGALLTLAPGIVSVVGFLATGGLTATLAAIAGGFATVAAAVAPVVIALAAVGAAAAALALAWYRDWGGMRQRVADAISAIQSGLREAWQWMISAWDEVSSSIVSGVDEVLSAFSEMDGDLRAIMDLIQASIIPTIQALADSMAVNAALIKAAWVGIKGTVATVWAALKPIVVGGMKMLREVIEAGMAVLRGDWSQAWESLSNALEAQREAVYHAVKSMLLRGLDAVKDFVSSFSLAGMALGQAFARGIRQESESTTRALQDLADIRARQRGPVSDGFAALAGYVSQAWGKPVPPTTSAASAGPPRAEPVVAPSVGSSASMAQTVSAAEKVVSEVNRRVGGVFQPGNPEQCANFVRDVYRSAGVKLGVTAKPLDRGPIGAALASSFAGTDVGQIITDRSALKPGDIVTYANTYGNFEPGAITHAGIYSGGGQIVHRPTRSGVVTRAGLDDPGQFAYGVRPYAVAGEGAAEKTFQRLQQWREQMQGLSRAQETLETRLSAVDERYSSIAREGAALGASREDLARVEAARQAERGRLLTEQAEKERTLLAEMSAQRLELTGTEVEQERAALDKRFGDMVAYWQRVATETPALAGQVQEHITAIEREHEAARASLRKAQARDAAEAHRQAWMERYNQGIAEREWQVQMGREGTATLLGYLAEQLDAWQGTEAEKRAAMLRYRDEFQRDLQLRAEYQGAHYEESLEALLEHLMAQTDLTVAEQVRRDALLEELAAVRHAKTLEFQQAAHNVAQAFQGSFTSAFVGILNGQQTFSEGMKGIWRSLADTIIAEIARIIAKLIALRAMQMLTGFFFPVGGVGAGAGSSIGAMIPTFHSGGVVGAPGLRHDEVVAKLQTGEVVLSRSDLRAISESGGGGASVNLTVQNLHHHGPQDTQAMARDLGRRMSFYLAGG